MYTHKILSALAALLIIATALVISYAIQPTPGTIPIVLYSAVLTGGILGPVKNKVGNVVGAMWFGVNYVRAYVIPSNPNTEAQQKQRTFFATIVAAAKLILSTVIQPYWNPFHSQYSGFNAFCKKNLDDMTAPFNYADLIVSQGSLEPEIITDAIYAGADVGVSWSSSGQGNGDPSDLPVVVVYDSVNNVAFVSDALTNRDSGDQIVTVGGGRDATDLKAYLFFYRGSGDTLEVSSSDYAQVTA